MEKKIIPCLDTKDGRLVKGIHFLNVQDIGDPAEAARIYSQEGADEIAFLDISASIEKRKTMIEVAKRVAANVQIPFIVGGGISSIEDISLLFAAGANKVSLNTAAVKAPELIKEASAKFGKEKIIVAIDVQKNPETGYEVYILGGEVRANLDALQWAKKVESLGAGEILLTSIDADGTKEGYDLSITYAVSAAVNIPVIASGGAGKAEHFYEVLTKGKASAALAASVFHYGILKIKEIKAFLKEKGISVQN